jgi:hypothetical protein
LGNRAIKPCSAFSISEIVKEYTHPPPAFGGGRVQYICKEPLNPGYKKFFTGTFFDVLVVQCLKKYIELMVGGGMYE